MKVLYIGNYKDGTGWGNAAAGNILAMQSAGIVVVPRAVTYNSNKDFDVCANILDAEKLSAEGCDVVVQHVLPHFYSYNSDYRNVGYLDIESTNIRPLGWHKYCNIMDEMWVPSIATKEILEDSGVTVPIYIVPHPINGEPNVGSERIEELQQGFTFGFVGEFTERKNIKALVQAFHVEFDVNEPVNLFIKTSGKTTEFIDGYFEQIKRGLRDRKKYKKEVYVTGRMPEDEYIGVMSQIDCFVMPSRGEAYCIPAVEAMNLGIPSIYTEGTGMGHLTGWPVKSYEAPCFGATEALSGLDTALSTWREISVLDLCCTMRSVYQELSDLSARETIYRTCKESAQQFNYNNVGKKIKEILDGNSAN